MTNEDSLQIRECTEEDMHEIARLADLAHRSTLRPSADPENRWDRVVSFDRPIYRPLSLGNMTQYTVSAFYTTPFRLCVSIENKGSYTFERWVHWTYAMEKLNLTPADAMNVADWINAQLSLGGPEQGRYSYPNLFRENDKGPLMSHFNGA